MSGGFDCVPNKPVPCYVCGQETTAYRRVRVARAPIRRPSDETWAPQSRYVDACHGCESLVADLYATRNPTHPGLIGLPVAETEVPHDGP